MRVKANFGNRGSYFPGKITQTRSDGTFDILYDDGDKEHFVKRSQIKVEENKIFQNFKNKKFLFVVAVTLIALISIIAL